MNQDAWDRRRVSVVRDRDELVPSSEPPHHRDVRTVEAVDEQGQAQKHADRHAGEDADQHDSEQRADGEHELVAVHAPDACELAEGERKRIVSRTATEVTTRSTGDFPPAFSPAAEFERLPVIVYPWSAPAPRFATP